MLARDISKETTTIMNDKVIGSQESSPSNGKPSDVQTSSSNKKLVDVTGLETLSVCRAINAAEPVISNYLKTSENLPDNFLLFSIVDKLTLSLTTMHGMSKAALTEVISSEGLNENTTATAALANVDTMYKEMTKIIDKLRQISIRMPPGVHPHIP